MHVVAAIAGLTLIVIILSDAFETVVLPRRVTRQIRFTRLFYRYSWLAWRKLVGGLRRRRRRETLLSVFGPLSLLLLFQSWAMALILGFALLQWACGTRLHGDPTTGFGTALYYSGTTFTTLGLGDVQPFSRWARLLTVWEAGTGFGFLALVIGYLPVIYQAFSRRESTISLLDARAGSPPSAGELLRRAAEAHALHELDTLLPRFEQWAAEVLESHISYPVLTLFRSQHANESWVAALTTILDCCALLMVGRGAGSRSAQLTFAMARHAVVDLAQVLNTPPQFSRPDRMPEPDWRRLQMMWPGQGRELAAGASAPSPQQAKNGLAGDPAPSPQLSELRRLYEPYVHALADYLLLELPPWVPREGVPDNWQTSAWERAAQRLPPPEVPLPDDHV
jgi:hypothetical protein